MVNGDRLIKTPWREIAAVEKYPAADDLDDDDDDDDLIRDRSESHWVIARCMGKTCGSAVCGGGDSCHSSRTAWRNPFSETTVKQSEK